MDENENSPFSSKEVGLGFCATVVNDNGTLFSAYGSKFVDGLAKRSYKPEPV